MTPEEALSIVSNAASQFRGTLQDHQTIQDALMIIKKSIESLPKETKENKEAEPKK